jgi:antitoxin component HigA of HigAB toxin-antitoxin module
MNIKTEFVNPPISTRMFDWSAIDANTYEEGEFVGRGPDEQTAIAELMGAMGATCQEVAEELSKRGFSEGQISKLMNTPRYETA